MIENLKRIKKEIEFTHPEWNSSIDISYDYEDCLEVVFKRKNIEIYVYNDDDKFLISDNDTLGIYFINLFEDEYDVYGQDIFSKKYYKKGCSLLKEFCSENNFKNKFEKTPYIGACIFEQDISLVRHDIELMIEYILKAEKMFLKLKEDGEYE